MDLENIMKSIRGKLTKIVNDMGMDEVKQLRDATWGSVEKWNNIVDGYDTDEGCINCPLCRYCTPFNDGIVPNCLKCPVNWVSGKISCDNTPYRKWTNTDTIKGLRSQDVYTRAVVNLDLGQSPITEENILEEMQAIRVKMTPLAIEERDFLLKIYTAIDLFIKETEALANA